MREGGGKRCSHEQCAEGPRGTRGVTYTGVFLEGQVQCGEQGEFEDRVQ